MRLISVNPAGVITSFDLSSIPVWRFELGSVGSRLGVGIRYVTTTAAGTSFGMMAGIDTENDKSHGVLAQIAKVGFPRGERVGDRERFHEALKTMYNAEGMKPQAVDVLITKGIKLADIYHDFKRALSTGEDLVGKHEGWQWVLFNDLGKFKWPETALEATSEATAT